MSTSQREYAWSLFQDEVGATEALLGRTLEAWKPLSAV